jgi:hypothetical protein
MLWSSASRSLWRSQYRLEISEEQIALRLLDRFSHFVMIESLQTTQMCFTCSHSGKTTLTIPLVTSECFAGLYRAVLRTMLPSIPTADTVCGPCFATRLGPLIGHLGDL